jgi:phosphoglycolate phosphatase
MSTATPTATPTQSGRSRTSRSSARSTHHPTLEAVIFDKDGTLIDAHCWAGPVRAACRAMPQPDGYLMELLGLDDATGKFVRGSLTMTQTTEVSRERLAHAGVDADALFSKLDPRAVPIIPLTDVPRLFHELRGRGLKVGVLTSDDRDMTEAFLQQVGAHADAMICGDDGRGAKPSRDPLVALCEDLRLSSPAAAVLVGDSDMDVLCGRAAGARTVAVGTGVTGAHELASIADAFAPSVGDGLLPVLDAWRTTLHCTRSLLRGGARGPTYAAAAAAAAARAAARAGAGEGDGDCGNGGSGGTGGTGGRGGRGGGGGGKVRHGGGDDGSKETAGGRETWGVDDDGDCYGDVGVVLLNTPMQECSPLLQRLANNSSILVCADGAANRLHDSIMARQIDEKTGTVGAAGAAEVAGAVGAKRTVGSNGTEGTVRADGIKRAAGTAATTDDDGGYTCASPIRLPDVVTGDFDSAREQVLDYYRERGCTVVHNSCQDSTDFEKALVLVEQALRGGAGCATRGQRTGASSGGTSSAGASSAGGNVEGSAGDRAGWEGSGGGDGVGVDGDGGGGGDGGDSSVSGGSGDNGDNGDNGDGGEGGNGGGGGKATCVIAYGAFGDRFDHELASIALLYRWHGRFDHFVLMSDRMTACLLGVGRHRIVRLRLR